MKKIIFFLSLLGLVSISTELKAQANKVVFVEISNGTGCSPCLNTFEELRLMSTIFPDEIAFAYYAEPPVGMGDAWNWWTSPMSDILDTFNIMYQSDCLVDRTFINNNNSYPSSEVVNSVDDAFVQQSAMSYVPVAIDIAHTFDPTTRAVNADVTVNFVDTASGNLGIYFILVQDEVSGPSSPGIYDFYDQLGEPWDAAMYGYTDLDSLSPNLVAINSFPHFKPVQYIASGFFGNAGVINSSVSSGDTFTENFSFTLDQYASPQSVVPLVPEEMEIIVAVVKNNGFKQRPVLNAAKKRLTDVSSTMLVEHNLQENPLIINGNPVENDVLSLVIKSDENMQGDVSLFNVLGEKVHQTTHVSVRPNHPETIEVSVAHLEAGVYFVGYKVGNKQYTKKVFIQ